MVGGQAGLAGHIHVGDGAQFAAQTGVHTNVAPGQRLIGSPAEELRPYGRQVAAMKHLPDLMRAVGRIERELARQKTMNNPITT